MARKTIDCRTIPSENNCTVVISGAEDEVLELAAAHAVAAHGHEDNAELREGIRAGLRDEEIVEAEEGSFVQLIEYHTRDLEPVLAAGERWREEIGKEATARWAVFAADRDRPDTFVQLVGFPDYDSAMRNSEHRATDAVAKRMQEITDGDSGFRNLDVRVVMHM